MYKKILITVGVVGFLLLAGYELLINKTLVFINNTDVSTTQNDISAYKDNGGNPVSCLIHKITLDELRKMAYGKGIQVTQSDVDEINQTPLCQDYCLEQLDYSKKYNDWFAPEDLRKTCTSLGIPLPKDSGSKEF